jgi:FkbM family methyltransferase
MIGCLKWLRSSGLSVNTVIDVGASNGCWSRCCIQHGFPDAAYVLCEPNPIHQDSLNDFLSKEGAKCRVCDYAISESGGNVPFMIGEDAFGGSIQLPENPQLVENVKSISLDTLASNLALIGPFLIKLDTHGFETQILRGATNLLADTAVLIIEAYAYQLNAESVLFWQLCQFLDAKGFGVVDIVDLMPRKFDNALWQMDIVFIRKSWKGFRHVHYL